MSHVLRLGLVSLIVFAGMGAAAEAPSAPTSMLELWLRADAGVESADGRVTLWRDQSGRGNDAHGDPATAPVWSEDGLNGRPCVRFDGRRSFLKVAHQDGLNATGGFTALCVFSYSGGFRIAQKKDGSGGVEPGAWFLTPQQGLGVGGNFARRDFFLPKRVNLQTSVFDPASQTIRLFRNGLLLNTLEKVAAQTPNSDPLYLGKRNMPGRSEGYLKGDLAELLIYSRALSDAERKQAEDYLRAKYRIAPPPEYSLTVTRVIPGDHQATIEWLRPAKVADVSRLRYRVSLKFRSAPWEDAQVLDLPGDRTSATIDDLLNGADYSVRVVAEEAGSPKPVAINEERLVTPGYVPGVVIDYLHREDPVYEQKGQYVGSPSLARLDDGRLVASHDLFGPGSSDFTRVFISADGGRTWRHASDVQPAFWGKLFTHRGKLYLLACSKPSGDLLLHPSPDGGATWGKPVVLARGKFHKAPVPVVEHGGRLWTCVEGSGASWAAGFGAVALSAPADADLLDPKSWTVSEPRPYDPAWLPKSCKLAEKKHGFLEGNAVMDPEGHLLNVLRYHISPCFGKAVVLRIAEDGKSLSFDRIMEMPGGQCKFTIHRHPETGLYWSLVNHITNPEQPGMRNVLTLISSPDLRHWTLVRDILRDDADTAPRTTGFQYVDWLFDGRDIIFVSRTACNGAHSFHDANHLTFHRIPDFATGPRWVGP